LAEAGCLKQAESYGWQANLRSFIRHCPALRNRTGPFPQMVTHDAALGTAARAFGFDVRGI
jgi:hypothetical protein